MTLGDKLLKLRKEKNLTQEAVAEKISVTRQTVSNWELGQTSPDLEQARRISELYCISIDELIEHNIEVKNENNTGYEISNTEKLAGFLLKFLKIFFMCVVVTIVIGLIIIIIGMVSYKSISGTGNLKVTQSIENVSN